MTIKGKLLEFEKGDKVEESAEWYSKNTELWKTSIEDLSKSEMERLLKGMILYPFEQEALVFTSPKEPIALELTMKMLDAKMAIMAYSMEKFKTRNSIMDGI